jgi:hypothetical protein
MQQLQIPTLYQTTINEVQQNSPLVAQSMNIDAMLGHLDANVSKIGLQNTTFQTPMSPLLLAKTAQTLPPKPSTSGSGFIYFLLFIAFGVG